MSKSQSAIGNTCKFCGKTGSVSSVVVSRGNPLSRLMLVGEAPGEKEEELRKPFVGRSGKVLDKLFGDVGINSNDQVYICNVIKCRPPKNRRPLKSEIVSNLPWLYQQIKLVDPWIIILAGSTAVHCLLDLKTPMSTLRGKFIPFDGRLVVPIYHPAYLLRNPSKEKGSPLDLTRSDLLNVVNHLNTIEANGTEPSLDPLPNYSK